MKKTFISLGLLTALGATNLQAREALFTVSQEIHQEVGAIFSSKQHSTKVRFEKLAALAEQIQELNQWISEQDNWDKSVLDILSIVNGVLDFTFHQFKQRYEQAIYSTYTQEFRLFSSVRSTFKSNLKQLNDTLNGVRIIEISNLSLSQDDVAIISERAKALEEKILNAG